MATIEDFMKAAEGMEGVEVTPLTMKDIYDIYGEEPSKNEDGNNTIDIDH